MHSFINNLINKMFVSKINRVLTMFGVISYAISTEVQQHKSNNNIIKMKHNYDKELVRKTQELLCITSQFSSRFPRSEYLNIAKSQLSFVGNRNLFFDCCSPFFIQHTVFPNQHSSNFT